MTPDLAATAPAEALIASMRSEAARADGQAATLLGAAGVVVGVVLAAMLGRQWSPAHLSVPTRLVWWAAAAAAAVVAALVWLASAICPRLPSRPPAHGGAAPVVLLHAWDVLAADAAGELSAAFARTSAGHAAAVQAQAVAVARIVDRKFRAVRSGLRALAVAGVLMGLAAVLAVTS